MISEKELLVDLIKFVPVNSYWDLSLDSLPNLPVHFKKKLEDGLSEKYGIHITEEKRNMLESLILEFDLQDKIVHQYIYMPSGLLVFKGYDYLEACFIHKDFPNLDYLFSKYGDVLNLMN